MKGFEKALPLHYVEEYVSLISSSSDSQDEEVWFVSFLQANVWSKIIQSSLLRDFTAVHGNLYF